MARAKKFDGRVLLMGLGLLVPPAFILVGWGNTYIHIRHMQAHGTEATAVVTVRFTQVLPDLIGRSRETKHSRLEFDGYSNIVRGWVEPHIVPVIYDDTKKYLASQERRPVILGKKSDWYFSVLHQNYGYHIWFSIVCLTVVNLFCIPLGLVLVVTGLGLRAEWKVESQERKVESKE